METMKQQWEETEEEGGVLRGRLPPQHSSTNTSSTTTCDFTLSSESCSEEDGYPKLETEEKGSWGRNGSLDSDKNGGTESDSYELSRFNGGHVDNPDSKRNPGDEISGLDVKVVDVNFQESDVTNHQDEGDIRKGEEELPVFGSSPSKQSIEQNMHYNSLSKGTTGHGNGIAKTREIGDETLELDVKVEDVSFQERDVTNHQDEGDIRKGEEELPVFGSSPSKQSIEQNGHYDSLSNGATNHGNGIAKTREIEEQEASELYLERVYQKPAAHDFYCPHCNTCITKVIIRGSESEVTPPIVQSVPPEPVDPIRCTSCFSFLIPAGNWFFPKLIPKDEESNTEQGTNNKIVEVGEPVPAHDSNGRLQDQNSQTVSVSKDFVPSESAGASVSAIGKPTMPGQSVRVEFEAPLSGQKPTSLGQSVGVTFEVPSRDFNEAFYGQKSTMLGQSVGVEFAAPSNGLNETSTKSAQSVGVEFAAPSNSLNGTSYGEKPTTSAQSVGVEFSVPSQELNVTWYGPKPTLSAQSVEGSTADSIHRVPVPGELVEAGVGIIAAKAKPSGNTESSVGVQVLASSNDSNGTLQNQNPPAVGHSVEVSVHVTNKPASSEINVVAISPDVPQSNGAVASEGNILDCALGETYAGKTEPRESTTVIITQPEAATIPEQGDTKSLEILKSIVYGGLTEAITSLGIVTSAASADTATLNILALALANLFGGLFVIGHHIWELKSDQSRVPSSETGEQVDRYQKVLGKKENFFLHASVAILSFLVFGLVPPLVYGFSFRQSNNRDLKMAAVAAASLLCIIVLAIGKAHIHKPPKYIKTLLYYIAIGIGVGGLSYLAGDLIDKLIEKLGWFASNVSGNLLLPQMGVVRPALQSY